MAKKKETVIFKDACYKQRTFALGETEYQVKDSLVEVSNPEHVEQLDKSPSFTREGK